ncbi:MAG: hypothetical protein U9N84_04400 [Actinomycetota bacterium]|nr:hypothetical protein [Actinomycetota bacterium]
MRFLVPLILLVSACSSSDATVVAQASPVDTEPITISMSLYVIDDSAADSPLSSQRQLTELEEIAARMNDIWGEAGVELAVETVARIEAPAAVLTDLAAGTTSSFLDAAVGGGIDVPGPATINGFYVRRIGTANGMTPFGTRVFFVADEPTVNDERVSSHEVGHILGLHHALDDSGRLMFSGTNGTALVDAEITTARYAATGILDGLR